MEPPAPARRSHPGLGDAACRFGDIAKAIVAGANTVMLGCCCAAARRAGRPHLHQRQAVSSRTGEWVAGCHVRLRGNKSYSKDRYFQGDVAAEDKLIPEGIEARCRSAARCRPSRTSWSRPAPGDVLHRRGQHRRAAAPGQLVRITRRPQGEPPARHPDAVEARTTTPASQLKGTNARRRRDRSRQAPTARFHLDDIGSCQPAHTATSTTWSTPGSSRVPFKDPVRAHPSTRHEPDTAVTLASSAARRPNVEGL